MGMAWTLPDLLSAAEAKWGSGKLVSVDDLNAAKEQLTAANKRIGELEAAAIDPKPLNDRISALEGEVTAKDGEIAAQKATIKTLEENYQTAARQAQQQIAKAGVQAPVSGEAPKVQEGEKDFAAIVSELVTAGKTKTEAITACIALHPAKYAEAKKTGNFGKL